ncbi:hypothetical protein LSH36_726g01007 [Paralvinella palmiformis]|uniref:FAD-binding FR-type domain-containing protein n=1 Tax=Paralvinella palmiformis TaxID=53620 RepID=A0AAD9MUQ5_9ANNE|nr:hypothetical protein LSH36_726g01007 [Paralvinella palmiformis]
MVSISQNKKEIEVVKSELLPSDVTMLEFKRPQDMDYRSGQWLRLACDQLGSHEYHAFTLTSAPHEPHLSLYVDGPFGAGQQDWFRYEISVLVGAGIGIAPYASILKDFVYLTSSKKTFRLKCRKLYFIWVTGSQKHFEWFIDILRQVEDVDQNSVVEAHIFITQLFQSFDLRTTMLTRKVGVFSCGPAGITKGVQQACYTSSKRRKARFEHHFENF